MHTFRSPSGVDFTGTTWPSISIPSTPQPNDDIETTIWVYDPATGLLKQKIDDSGQAVTYTYTPDGKLSTRQWARHDANTVTTYTYDSNTGEMTGIDYPGSDTPDVTFTYTRLGRQATVQDGVGTRTFTYDEGVTGKLHLLSEAIAGTGGFYSKTITRDYQGTGTGEIPGRDAGFHIGTEYGVAYHYDNAGTGGQLTGTGRFRRITGPGLPGYVSPSTPGYGVEYARLANSDLLEYTSYKSDANTTLARTQRDYESNRDLIEWVENKLGTTQVSKYNYNATNDDLDALGRRTSVVYTGTAFAQSHLFKWGYNTRSELVTADRYQGTNPDSPGSQYSQYGDYEFAYDHIGNRLTYGLDANPDTTYTANDVNQYASTTYPTEAFAYDDDGNLTQDGTFDYTWDAENRLIAVTPRTPATGAKKVKFVYDYMGRRVRKEVFTYDNGWLANPDKREHFVYDGWNVVMVLDGLNSNATTRKYTWGLDLSGTIHGAGGIGGLLACEEPQAPGGPKRYWFLYDGNGNLTQVLDATDTNNISIAAHYEYDPYGNLINSSGTYKDANPFRFSTKWFDAQTDLGYWGYRYYSPRLGRWISRDPIGEEGGLNLQGFVFNDTLNVFDLLGACGSEAEALDAQEFELKQKYPKWNPVTSASLGTRENPYPDQKDQPAIEANRSLAREWVDKRYPAGVYTVGFPRSWVSGCCEWTQTDNAQEIRWGRVQVDEDKHKSFHHWRRTPLPTDLPSFPTVPGRNVQFYVTYTWYFQTTYFFKYHALFRFQVDRTCTKGRNTGARQTIYPTWYGGHRSTPEPGDPPRGIAWWVYKHGPMETESWAISWWSQAGGPGPRRLPYPRPPCQTFPQLPPPPVPGR